jgi:hypothetical protein
MWVCWIRERTMERLINFDIINRDPTRNFVLLL